jgi:hypothetical protein
MLDFLVRNCVFSGMSPGCWDQSSWLLCDVRLGMMENHRINNFCQGCFRILSSKSKIQLRVGWNPSHFVQFFICGRAPLSGTWNLGRSACQFLDTARVILGMIDCYNIYITVHHQNIQLHRSKSSNHPYSWLMSPFSCWISIFWSISHK